MYGLGFDKDMVKSKRIEKGYKAVTKDRRFKKEQEIYEHRLGQYAFKSKEANAATDQSIDKMKKVLVAYYKDKYKEIKNEEERNAKIFTDAFTTTREKNSAGQVGNVSYGELSKIINAHTPGKSEIEKNIDNETGLGDATNLREKMTALCNAAYMNNTRDTFESENPATTFKRIVWDIAKQKNYEKAKALQESIGLDASTLDEYALESRSARKKGVGIRHRHRWITALYNTGLWGLVKKISGSLFPKDPYDVGIAAFNSGEVMQYKRKRDRFNIFKKLKYRRQHGRGQFMANIKSVTGLVNRDKIKDQGKIKSQEKMRRSLDYYDNMGLNLSNRERLYISNIVGEEYIEKHHSPLQQEGESDKDFNVRKRKYNLQQYFLMSKALNNPDIGGRIFTSEMKNELDKLMGGKGSEESKKFYEEAMNPGVEARKHALKYIFFMDKVLEKLKIDNQNKLSEEMEAELDKLMGGQKSKESKEFYEEAKDPKSSIKEGIVWKQHKSKGFLANMEKKHSVRIVNGISGTTIRMMKTAKWLGLKDKDLMNFRLALMGWMLPTDDHSLWEIIIGSHNVGVKGEEDMTDVPSLDMTVDPLNKFTLRQKVCSREVRGEPMFPHEIVADGQRRSSSENNSGHYRRSDTLAISEKEIDNRSSNMFAEYTDVQLAEYEENKARLKKLSSDAKISKIIKLQNTLAKSRKSFVDAQNNPEEQKKQIENKLNENRKKNKSKNENMSNAPTAEEIEIAYERKIDGLRRGVEANEKKLEEAREDARTQIFEYDTLIREINDFEMSNKNSLQKMAVLNYTGSAYDPLNMVAFASSGPRLWRSIKYRYLRSKIVDSYMAIQYEKDNRENPKTKEEKESFAIKIHGLNRENLDKEYRKELQKARKEKDEGRIKKVEQLYKAEVARRKRFGKSKEYKHFIGDLQADDSLLLDTLVNVKNKYKGKVYRGTWGINGIESTGTTKFSMFTSTTKYPFAALQFIGGLGGLSGIRKTIGHNTLMEIKLKGLNGVDLTTSYNIKDPEAKKHAMSIYNNKQGEVLCPPGTKIRIKKIIKNVNLTKYVLDTQKAKDNQEDPTIDLNDNAVAMHKFNSAKERKAFEKYATNWYKRAVKNYEKNCPGKPIPSTISKTKIGNLIIAEEVK